MIGKLKSGEHRLYSRKTGATFVFLLPGSRGACRDAWEGFLPV